MNRLIEIIVFTLILNSCGAYAGDVAYDQDLHKVHTIPFIVPDKDDCGSVIDDCEAVNQEQERFISQLKRQVEVVELELKQTEDKTSPWVWGLMGFVAGGFAYTILGRLK